MPISEQQRTAAAAAGAAAAKQRQPLTVCPHKAQQTPQERALARIWVRAYLDVSPGAAGTSDTDELDDAEDDPRRTERYDPSQPRDDGQWTSTGGAGAAASGLDKLRLAGRIPLEVGERRTVRRVAGPVRRWTANRRPRWPAGDVA